jgi:hypothetical protein
MILEPTEALISHYGLFSDNMLSETAGFSVQVSGICTPPFLTPET